MKHLSLVSVISVSFAALVVLGLSLYEGSESATGMWALAFGLTAAAAALAVVPYWAAPSKRTSLAIIGAGFSLLGVLLMSLLTDSSGGLFLSVIPLLCTALAIGYAAESKARTAGHEPYNRSQSRAARITLGILAAIPVLIVIGAQTISTWDPSLPAVASTVLMFAAVLSAPIAIFAGWHLRGVPAGYALCTTYGVALYLIAVITQPGGILALIYLGAWYLGIAAVGFGADWAPMKTPQNAQA